MNRFRLVTVSVVCRENFAQDAIQEMLEASNGLSVYGFECSERPLTKDEWREVVNQTPSEVLDD